MRIQIGCSVSSVVGFFCYVLSSSFCHLFGKRTWWKTSIYVVLSLIICLAILFAKAWQNSIVLPQKANLAFWLLIITSVYSFFQDLVVKGKPDAYSVISSAAFAIMSLGLSKLTDCGIELDLLYFFCVSFITQLMRIKLWLLTVGGVFSFSLIRLRDYLKHSPENGPVERLNSGTGDIEMGSVLRLQVGSDSVEISNVSASASAIHVDSVQANTDVHPPLPPEANFVYDSDVLLEIRDSRSQDQDPCVVTQADSPSHEANSYRTMLMTSIEELKKKNPDIISMIRGQIAGPELSEERIQQLALDLNIVRDGLPSETISKLQEAVKLMESIHLGTECCNAYSSWRREFLVECLSTFGLQEFDMVEEVESWIKASNLAREVLFPNERILCLHIFQHCHQAAAYSSFVEVCRELTMRLLRFPITLITASHSPNLSADLILKMYNTLRDLRWRFELLFLDKTFTKDASAVMRMLRILKNCAYLFNRDNDKVIVPSGGLHPVTPKVMSKLAQIFSAKDPDLVVKSIKNVEGDSLLSRQIACIMEKLESNLETRSRNYNDPALRCFSRMNNLRYMEELAKQCGLVTVLGDGWLENIRAKVQQNLGDYLSNSWNKLLNYLELKNNETEEAMKEKLNSFNHRFQKICYRQSEWFVFDEQLREKIMESIENMLVVPYGIYIGRFRDAAGESAHNNIRYGIRDIQNQLCNMLFLESNGKNQTVVKNERTFRRDYILLV